jgi:hypothetical protein
MTLRNLWIQILLLNLYSTAYSQSSGLSVTHNKLNTEYACLYNNKDSLHIAGFSLINIRSSFTYFHSIYIPSKKTATHKISYISENDYAWRNINLLKSRERYISCFSSAFSDDSFNKTVLVADNTGQIVKNVETGLKTKGGVYFQYIYENPDSSFTVYAQIDFRNPNRPFYNQLIYKLDKNFKTLDSIFVDSFNYINQYQTKVGGLIPSKAGQYRIVMNPYLFSCDISQSKFNPQIVDFDQNLKIISSRPIIGKKIMLNNSLFVDNNSSIIYGQTMDTNVCLSTFQYGLGRPYIAMVDSSLNFKWEIEFEKGKSPPYVFLLNYGLDRLIKLKDGNFLAVGNYDYPSSKNPIDWYGSAGLMIKFTKEGKILWSKRHRYDDSVYCAESSFTLRDVAELSNGEIVAIGAMSVSCSSDTSRSGQRGWILHIDAEGEFIKSQILDTDLSNPISVYPNPFGDRIQIDNLENGHFSYSVFNAIGQKIADGKFHTSDRRHSIVLDALARGTYTLNITNESNQIVSSSKVVKE